MSELEPTTAERRRLREAEQRKDTRQVYLAALSYLETIDRLTQERDEATTRLHNLGETLTGRFVKSDGTVGDTYYVQPEQRLATALSRVEELEGALRIIREKIDAALNPPEEKDGT